jgi:hypothetical protein
MTGLHASKKSDEKVRVRPDVRPRGRGKASNLVPVARCRREVVVRRGLMPRSARNPRPQESALRPFDASSNSDQERAAARSPATASARSSNGERDAP